ncbi:hypothetical protein UFOVP257_206 [uncultured Caudovirales phage]|uniref:Uncharacterized protein n=1 Tax=uncultured Caudovirales phage TaxID=2100421 RepID=A0A6J5LH13_9CAUD|nr:hypothetical protein UFOVP257_206 [uncultured Caudovirales phage]
MRSASVQNVGVYHDSDISLWHFNQLTDYTFNDQDYFKNSESVNNFLNSNYPLKFAGYHVPFPVEDTWISRFYQTYTVVSHSFIFCSELHEGTIDQLLQLDLPNVSIFICGFFNTHQFVNAKIYRWMDWFVTTAYFYSVVNGHLIPEKLSPNINKEKYFDVLLGCTRIHRNYVHDYINTNDLNNSVIMTYHRRADQKLSDNGFIFETDGLELKNIDYNHTVNEVRYFGRKMSLSQVVPFSIYNKTHYTLVAETNFSNKFNFYTEKIVKPIMCGRLFIVIAGRHYLKNLKSFGFKTFDSVIDESYDNEINDAIRWAKAMGQVKLLCDKDPAYVYNKISDVVKHNQSLMLSHDWYHEFSLQLKSVLDLYLTSDYIIVD